MQDKIECSCPKQQYLLYANEIQKAVMHTLETGQYILGQAVNEFEENFAKFTNSKYAIAVASGTDALFLTLTALGIGLGDEVITVPNTALATISAICATGATPVLVDIERKYHTMDVTQLEYAINSHTKAILPVHLYGQPADLTKILEVAAKHKIVVVEDCAQAHGSYYNEKHVGTYGIAGCFSFYPTKNLGAIGDAGAIVTNDAKLAEKLSRIRQYGWDENRISQFKGVNSRMDALQASILNVKLRYLAKSIKERQEIAEYYTKSFASLGQVNSIEIRDKTIHSFHLYVVLTENRDLLKQFLQQNNIFAGIHYAKLVHEHPGYKSLIRLANNDLVVANSVVNKIISIPLYPGLKFEQQQYIVKIIKKFFQ